jgi:uncharacterized membrane protein YbhN (UPF0104 family)
LSIIQVTQKEPPTKNQQKSFLLRWAGTLISLALLVYLLGSQGWPDIWQAVQSIPPTHFGIAIGLMLLSRLSVVGRWYVLVKAAGQNMTLIETTRLVFAGLFASNFLPTTIGGDVIRLAGAVRRNNNPSVITASLLADRLIGMAGMVSLLPVGLPYLLATSVASISGESLTSLCVVGIKTRIDRWWNKGRDFIGLTSKALLIWIRKPTSLLIALLCTYGHQAALFTTIWILFQGMGQNITWWMVAGLWIFNYFITVLPISINGLGVQELSIAYIYSQFGGVSTDSSLVMAILIRVLYIIASLPGVIALPDIFESRHREIIKESDKR